MMGPTHALGGATALAAFTIATGSTDVMPLWGYGVAAIGALVPDLDNSHGTMLGRKQFFPIKWGTYPLWARAKHRGFTHSIFGTAMFAAIMLAWWFILRLAFAAGGAEWPVPVEPFVIAAVIGYISHIVLDMLNLTGVELLYPLPFRFFFPPWKPLRFGADSLRSELLVHIPMTLFMGWFMIEHFGAIVQASTTDGTLTGLLRAVGQLIGNLAEFLLGGASGESAVAPVAGLAAGLTAVARRPASAAENQPMGPYGLIVVDYQNDFADLDGSLSVAGGRALLPHINAEADAATAAGAPIFYTQDWHPAETSHFANFGGVWPVHCVGGTWGAKLVRGLKVNGFVILKGANGEDGYSGFSMRDPASGETVPTHLEEALRREGVSAVRVCGLATDYCVKATALDAARLGFTTTFVSAASAAVNLASGDGDAAIAEMRAAGVVIE